MGAGCEGLSDSVRVIPRGRLRAGARTPGVNREIALETQTATVMRARADAHACSGWHHHGAREVLGYVVSGEARFEFGPDGRGRGVHVAGTPERGAVLQRATELVRFARRRGYDTDELIDLIRQLGA